LRVRAPRLRGFLSPAPLPRGATPHLLVGKEKRGLLTALTFPHYKEGKRGEYITEDQCLALVANYGHASAPR